MLVQLTLSVCLEQLQRKGSCHASKEVGMDAVIISVES